MTEPYFADDRTTVYLGKVENVLPTLPDASVDAVVTDPPYEISFMARTWDASGIAYNVEMWAHCWRVLKPGGHLVAFGAPRTYHRMAVAIEDAGFEIRDSMHWIFGTGFPKGQDIAKSIDRRRDDRAQVLQVTAWLAEQAKTLGWDRARLNGLFGFHVRGQATHWITQGVAARVPNVEQWSKLRESMGFDDMEILPLVLELNGRKGSVGEAWGQREVTGRRHSGLSEGGASVFLSGTTGRDADGMVPITAPASDAARQWQGWNTSLKPAHEPIVLARKSTGFDTTVANVLKHGTGALNIDACRIGDPAPSVPRGLIKPGASNNREMIGRNGEMFEGNPAGRWPSNVVMSHQPLLDDAGEAIGDACADGCVPGCPVAELDQQTGVLKSGANPTRRSSDKFRDAYGDFPGQMECTPARGADEGGASRFFPVFRYEAKAPASERPRLADGTAHTTVKPLTLMRWLVRLVTQPGGTVLDPFAGSGTTGEACGIEGFRSLLIEQDPAHAELIKARLNKPLQAVLGFEEPA